MVDLTSLKAEDLHGLSPSAVTELATRMLAELKVRAEQGQRDAQALHAAVVVAASPSKWGSCTFDGFVKSNPRGGVGDALAMFNMLAALMAPDYLCPFDAYDILSCVGSATEPSYLHSATFFPDSGDAIPDSENADKSLRTCAAMAECVNDFATRGVMNLLCRAAAILGLCSPSVAG